jgi:hypothetical protein
LDCRHVCKTCAFHDALQSGKQKEVHPPYSPDLATAGVDSPVPQNVAIITSFHTTSNSLFSITYTTESHAGQSAILILLLNKS